jgi:hypothetical protein
MVMGNAFSNCNGSSAFFAREAVSPINLAAGLPYIACEQTTNKTVPDSSTIVTSLRERTPKKTTVPSIVALPSNGCKQRSHC